MPDERPTEIRGRIAHELGVAIVSGRLPPGTPLLSEGRFSAERGVSRGAYREAIRILAAKGLVYNRVKSTTLVSERERWSMLDSDVLSWIFASDPDAAFVDSIFELRRMVEPFSAFLAAQRRTERDLARMGHALQEMERYGLRDPRGRAADQAFHIAVLAAARNEPLMTLANSIKAAVEWTTRFARDDRGQDRDPMPDHHAVYGALAASNPDEARLRMEMLIDNALKDANVVDQPRDRQSGHDEAPSAGRH
jgi:DNA-binding FadR family transcriptional regulator